VFLGYSSHHKGYKCYHHEFGRMYISWDVVFHEDVFPFLQTSSKSVQSPSYSPTYSSFSLPINNISVSVPTLPSPSSLNTNSSNTHSPTSSSSSHVEPDVTTVQSLDTAPPRLHPMQIRSQNNVRQIQQHTNGTVRYPLPRALLSEAALLEPTCFSNAVKVSEWRNAMQVKFNAPLKNRTWSFVPPQATKNVVGCKWVFKLKRKASFVSEMGPWTLIWSEGQVSSDCWAFPPIMFTCLANSPTREGAYLKCPTSSSLYSPDLFISHGVSYSLNTSFDSEMGSSTLIDDHQSLTLFTSSLAFNHIFSNLNGLEPQ
jgi:hypothetical protein